MATSVASSMPGAGEQHERAGNLGGREDAQAAIGAGRDPDAAVRQAKSCRPVRRRQSRDEREEHRGRNRQAGADPEHARIDGDVERADGEAGRVTADDRDERPRQQQPEHRAGATEHQALGEQRPPQRAGAGAERGTDGQLPFAAHRSRQDQVGDVRARDDEHDSGGGQQQQQHRPRRRGDLIAEPSTP